MIVPRSRLAEVEELARTRRGVLHRRRPVRGGHARSGRWCRRCSGSGCAATSRRGSRRARTLVTGGAEAPDGLDTGFFVKPTVFSNVTTDMTIAQEEIFGPVLVDHAVRHRRRSRRDRQRHRVRARRRGGRASDERAQTVARKIRAGQVRVNAGELLRGGAVRRLQAVGSRTRARRVRPGGVPRGEGAVRLMDGAASRAVPHLDKARESSNSRRTRAR